jgi:hypothetical protein
MHCEPVADRSSQWYGVYSTPVITSQKILIFDGELLEVVLTPGWKKSGRLSYRSTCSFASTGGNEMPELILDTSVRGSGGK